MISQVENAWQEGMGREGWREEGGLKSQFENPVDYDREEGGG